MTEKELRIAHNKAALQATLENRQRMYPGMIKSVEMDDDCMVGAGILGVTDDVFDTLPKQLQYTPHIQQSVTSDGKVLEQPKKRAVQSPVKFKLRRSVDLNTLL